MGPLGVQEMIVIFLLALLLFGPKKLPELGKTIGKAITEFRRAQSELKSTFEGHMRELERESESIKEVTRSYTNDIYNQFSEYDSSYNEPGVANPESSTQNPSTVSAPALPGAEPTVSHEAPMNGTVPRNGTSEQAHHADPNQPGAEQSHSVSS